jgi:hypothetical protein
MGINNNPLWFDGSDCIYAIQGRRELGYRDLLVRLVNNFFRIIFTPR